MRYFLEEYTAGSFSWHVSPLSRWKIERTSRIKGEERKRNVKGREEGRERERGAARRRRNAFVILVNNALCINLWTTTSRVTSSRGVVTMIYAYKGCYLDFITVPQPIPRRLDPSLPLSANRSLFRKNSNASNRRCRDDKAEQLCFLPERGAYKFVIRAPRELISTRPENLLITVTSCNFPTR